MELNFKLCENRTSNEVVVAPEYSMQVVEVNIAKLDLQFFALVCHADSQLYYCFEMIFKCEYLELLSCLA